METKTFEPHDYHMTHRFIKHIPLRSLNNGRLPCDGGPRTASVCVCAEMKVGRYTDVTTFVVTFLL